MGALSRRRAVAALETRPDHAATGSRGAGAVYAIVGWQSHRSRPHARSMACPPSLNRSTYSAVILRSALLRASRRIAAGACGPSFEARREERRAPQDDGGYIDGGHGAKSAFAHPTCSWL